MFCKERGLTVPESANNMLDLALSRLEAIIWRLDIQAVLDRADLVNDEKITARDLLRWTYCVQI